MERTNKKNNRKSQIDLSTMVYGKVPPQAIDLEKAILGAIMLESKAFDIVSGLLTPKCFYMESHQRIFHCMQNLQQKNQPIDILTVIEELKFNQELDIVGGPYFVTCLTNAVVSSANIEAHSNIILRKFIKRELIRISGEILNDAYEDSTDVFDLLEQSEQNLLAIGMKNLGSEIISIDSVLVQSVKQIEEWRKNDSTITGVPSGFKTIDRATRGWQPGDLIIVAARPSVGKSALALTLAKNAVQNKIKSCRAAIWSLEMSSLQLSLRMLSDESNIWLHKIQTGRLNNLDMDNLYENGIQKLAKNNIFFDDSSGLTLYKLRGKARRLKKKYPDLGLIVIDYLQLMIGENNGNREQEISSISRGLKMLAKELRLPIIALSQLSRAIENKGGKPREPMLSDLRESGAIEQDADVVLLLWGPDDEAIKNDASLINKRYGKIAKQRNGFLTRLEFEFATEVQRITEFEIVPENQNGSWKPIVKQEDLF